VIDVHAHEPETIYVVPIKSDSEHFVPGGQLRVFRSRTGGNEWEALTKGLPQRDCYVNVLRMPWLSIRWMSAGFILEPAVGRSTPRRMLETAGLRLSGFAGVLSVEVQTLG